MHLKNLSIIFLIIELILIRESISWPDSNDDGTTTNCISTSSLTTTTTSSPTTSAATTTPKKPEPSFNISGWDWINKTRNPSGFEEYFFTTSDINLKYKLSQQVNAAILVSKVESLKASFSYWVDRQTDSIDIRITQCFRTEITRVDFSNKKVAAAKWNYQEFDLRFDESCLEHITFSVLFDSETDSYVAIRNLTISVTATTNGVLTNIGATCGKSNCTQLFDLLEPGTLKWSYGKPPQYIGYYRASRLDPLKIELYNMDEGDDAVFEFKYWISGPDATMTIQNERESLIVVGETISSTGELQLFSGTFKSSDFSLRHSSSQLQFAPSFTSNETVIGITEVVVRFIDGSYTTDLPNFIISSTENEFENWRSVRIPQESLNFADKNGLTVGGTSQTMVSLFSDWLNMTSDHLNLRILLGKDQTANVIVNVVEEAFDNGWKVNNFGEQSLDGDQRKEIKIPGGEGNILRRIRIDFITNGSSINVMDVSFGDECVPNPCNEKDTEARCERIDGGKKECTCSKSGKFRGELCKNEDFCKPNSENGTNYCEKRGAVGEICIPHETKDKNRPFDCVCNRTTDYWDTTKESCTLFGDCKRVISCEVGYKCVEPVSNTSDPCSHCAEDYNPNADGKCEPIDICERDCGKHQLCVKKESIGMRSAAFCYCPSGHKLVSNKCEPLFESCPKIFAKSAKCDFGCEFNSRSDNKVGYNVTCLPPPTTPSPTTSSTLPTTDARPTAPHPTTTAAYQKSSRSKREDKSSICDDPKEVEAFCGTGISTCNETSDGISCQCPHDHYQIDIVEGDALEFGCVLRKDCESSLSIKDRKEGQICRINERTLESYWTCEPGMILSEDGTKCIPQCDSKNNTLTCAEQDKVCQVNPLASKPKCVCQPGFEEESGRCQMTKYSYITSPFEIVIPSFSYGKINGPLLLKSSESDPPVYKCPNPNEPDAKGCLEKMMAATEFESKSSAVLNEKSVNLLEQELINGMNILFSDNAGYQGASLLSRQVSEQDRKFNNVQAVLKFAQVQDEKKLRRKLVEECNKKKTLSGGPYCVIPGGLHFDTTSLEGSKIEILDPCSDSTPIYCPGGTSCSIQINGTSAFRCECSNGHRIVKTSILGDAKIDHCEDIDECGEGTDGCPKESTCINLRGSFTCKCPKGEVWHEDNNNCINVCEGIVCSNGGYCNVRDENIGECICADGFKGETCEMEDKKVFSLRAGLISVSVILGVLFFVAVGIAYYCHKKAGKRIGGIESIEVDPGTENIYFESISAPSSSTKKYFNNEIKTN